MCHVIGARKVEPVPSSVILNPSSNVVCINDVAAVMSCHNLSSVFSGSCIAFLLCRHFGAAVVHLCLWGNRQWASGCRDWDWRGMSRVFYTTAGTIWSSSGTWRSRLFFF